jgi:hypothetical protein
MWRLLDQVDPTSRTDARRRGILAELLVELSDAEVIGLPSDRSFDRTEIPHLPRFVTVARPARSAPAVKQVVWHPELSWVPGARLTPSQLDFMASVNTWLFRRRGPELVVPVRERSLEIFGDEKTLDRLLLTNLFAPERLTLVTLRARRAVPPFHSRVVGEGTMLLIVENSDTFDSITRALAERPGPVGIVGWGAGAAFEASVLSIADLEHTVSDVRYFGDIDRVGLRVPANASTVAVDSGLPPVLPAVALYSALLTVGRPRPGQPKVSETDAKQLVDWLDPIHREPVTRLLVDGHRLAQEAVGLAYLLRNEGW